MLLRIDKLLYILLFIESYPIILHFFYFVLVY